MRTFSLLLLASALPAQFVVVDASGGPGSQYTNLATAAAAVPDGTTLLVRPGTYTGIVTIAGKGLRILADPGVTLASAGIVITNTQASQPCLLRGLAVASIPDPPSGWGALSTPLVISGCQGRVVLEQCSFHPWPATQVSYGPASSASIGGSPQVALRNCTFQTDTNVSGSHLAAEGCVFQGRVARYPSWAGSWQATPAIQLFSGTVQLARCTVQGGGSDGPFGCGGLLYPDQPGISLSGGTAVVRRSGAISGGANCSPPAAAVSGSGTLRIDPAVVVTGALTVSPAPQFASMPTVRSTSAGLGGTITASGEGTTGDVLLLVLGLPGAPLVVPGFVDPFWMQPAAHEYAAIGVTSPLAAVIAVPVLPALRGFELVWQTVTWNATGFAVSHPSLAFVY